MISQSGKSRHQVHYGLYETLFSDTGLHALSEFPGVSANPDHVNVRVNTTVRTDQLQDDIRRRVRAHYADVYAFCLARFPETETLWTPVG